MRLIWMFRMMRVRPDAGYLKFLKYGALAALDQFVNQVASFKKVSRAAGIIVEGQRWVDA